MKEYQLASAQSVTSAFNSVQLDLGDMVNFAIQVTFSSATINGTLTLEGSLDKETWTTIPSSTQAVTSGAAHMWSVEKAGYRYVRASWAYTSGTGTLTMKAFLKEMPIKGA